MGKLTETLRPPFQNLKVRVSRVQQESQRPRAAVGSDPENEITEKKDYNQREETGRRWAYEKLEPWSEWIPGDTQNVNSTDILPKTYAAQCSTLFGNPFYRIFIGRKGNTRKRVLQRKGFRKGRKASKWSN